MRRERKEGDRRARAVGQARAEPIALPEAQAAQLEPKGDEPGARGDVPAEPLRFGENLPGVRAVLELPVAIDDLAGHHDGLGVRALAGADEGREGALQHADVRPAHVDDGDVGLQRGEGGLFLGAFERNRMAHRDPAQFGFLVDGRGGQFLAASATGARGLGIGGHDLVPGLD